MLYISLMGPIRLHSCAAPLGPFLPIIPLPLIPPIVPVVAVLTDGISVFADFEALAFEGAIDPDLRAIRALIVPSHLTSSSSLGAQRSIVRFVVTILNVCVL